MQFSLPKSIEILASTPATLYSLLANLSTDWTLANEGAATWSAYDVIGHLIHGEKTDWMPRAEIILNQESNKAFKPFDRFAQFENSKGKTLLQLLDEFSALRKQNIELLISKNLSDSDLLKTGLHPAFGEVTLSQLLATWTVHDLNHIAQISRVMALQYKTAVGPWTRYLKILNW